MRIEKPRSPGTVMVTLRGRQVERQKVGPAQHAMLGLLVKLGTREVPKKGTLTPTGFLREHILNDMIPLGWVTAKVARPGVTDYLITPRGRDAYAKGIVQDAPKAKGRRDGRDSSASLQVKATSGLLARQRARHAAKLARGKGRRDTGRRAATG